MQPYSYVPYPNPAPIPYVTPLVYQTPPVPQVAPMYDPYGAMPYNPQIVGYTPVQPAGYVPVAPAPGYYSNGVNPGAFTNFQGSSRNRPKAPENERQQKLFETLAKNGNVNSLMQQKGTNVNVSKIYHVKKAKPGFQKDWDDDDNPPPLLPMQPLRPPSLRQPAMIHYPPPPMMRIPSASSTCSDCSECSSPNGNRHCPDCEAEWDYERSQHRRDAGN